MEASEPDEGAAPVSVDDLPLPDEYEAWEEYEALKVQYQRESREYERIEKLALDTFPNENRKVFSALIDCISESSVQDLKRSTEGRKLFQECDSLGFFNLALKEHEYLTPTISAAAVARAKDEFENLRQKSEDTIIEHVNEFRRRLEVYIKARGPGSASPYEDFDLRFIFTRSLYQPAWSSWIQTREDNENLPRTFEALVDALKMAEATKILKSPTLLDPMMHTAHATAARNKSLSPVSLDPVKCTVCGVSFQPKMPQHTRCDKCQETYSKEKKQEYKKNKEKHPSKKKKGKKSDKKAHLTAIEENTSDDESDEEDPDVTDEQGLVSFSCICSTKANEAEQELIYLDNCSNLNVIRDRTLALNIRKEKVPTRISGSIPGIMTAYVSAELGDLGRGCHDANFSRNLISEQAAIKAGYTVTRDSSVDNSYYLKKNGSKPLEFKANSEGTYSISVKEFKRHFSTLYAIANVTEANSEIRFFTKKQRERAAQYFFDHAHCLNHLHHDRVILALRKGLITHVPYTEADVRNAQIIHGPCPTCARTKGTRHRELGHYPAMPNAPGERLAGDIFSIMGTMFFMVSCRLIKFRCVTTAEQRSNRGDEGNP